MEPWPPPSPEEARAPSRIPALGRDLSGLALLIAAAVLFWLYPLSMASASLDWDGEQCYGREDPVAVQEYDWGDVVPQVSDEWTWWPPGWTCTYGAIGYGVVAVEGPSAWNGISAVAAWGTVVVSSPVWLRERWRRRRRRR